GWGGGEAGGGQGGGNARATRPGSRREVPRLLAPGRLPPLGRLSRTLVEIGGALAGWMVFEWRRPSSRAGISRRLRTAFERLGSSYVKLGQIVSGGDGLFPDQLGREVKLLRDQVPPEPFPPVRTLPPPHLPPPPHPPL